MSYAMHRIAKFPFKNIKVLDADAIKRKIRRKFKQTTKKERKQKEEKEQMYESTDDAGYV